MYTFVGKGSNLQWAGEKLLKYELCYESAAGVNSLKFSI